MTPDSSSPGGLGRLHVRLRDLRWLASLASLLCLPLAACGDDSAGEALETGAATSFAPTLDVDMAEMESSPSGLLYRDLQVGDGPAASSGTVTVHYTGWLPDGTQFDSSRGGQPFQFNLGAGEVIPGWDEGVAGMQVGGRRQLVIPPALAYGEAGAGGVIPPNATLVFEVELLAVN